MTQFTDLKTNLVYFSKFFALRFPDVFSASREALLKNGIEVRAIGGNQNVWIRDWAPVQIGDHLVKFGYKGYSADGLSCGYEDYPWLIIPDKCFAGFKTFKPVENCLLVLDGGGIIRSETKSIITEKVYIDNPSLNTEQIISTLHDTLQTDIIIIPAEPHDQLGHADGICKFVDNNTVLINDYYSNKNLGYEWLGYADKLVDILKRAGLSVVLMPYGYDKCPQFIGKEDEFYERYPFSDDCNPAVGYYVNFLLTKNTIIAPIFGGDLMDKDAEAIATLKKCYPQHEVVAVNERELSIEGGLANCTTANYIK